jgi:LacI family transcriptional regulator
MLAPFTSNRGRTKARNSTRPKRATLADVARLSGVGPMTVSRTINGHPYVSEHTANKVRAAIRQLNYTPNQAARVLTGQLSRSIGLIVPDISDSFFSIISQAVQETAHANGYILWLAASGEDSAIEASQVEMMTTYGVDGILLVPAHSRKTYLKSLALGSTPVVTIDRPIDIAKTDSVEVENRAGARFAVDHLIQHGRKRIACIVTNPHLRTIQERISGFRDSMKRANLQITKEVHIPNQESTKAALSKLFASRNAPDALFTANNATTIWVIGALKELKVKVGKDLALVGFDDVDFFAQLTPAITAIRQPGIDIGKLAAEILLKNIHAETPSAFVKNVLPLTLIIRESCGCKSTDTRQ